ncbi:hypothetical protein RclHR1_09020001 [Rhizophagus clarus]|uniref:Protein kinase domain-containing protein n=1 Tax=Rhizophagus clarus TaxID=94130 RepID=A0A2Z6S951_9GLOM|nr:hypothetical protein RclHR1_09020001 [Rhizophagus clarus]
METEFNKLNISDKNSDKNSNLKNINHGNCSYCNEPFTEELWCKKCDPFRMIEGWTSGNNDIDKFIKGTIYDARNSNKYNDRFVEWVSFDKFKDIKQIGEGGFAKVYSATWIDGKTEYVRQDDGSWKKREPESLTVALKRLNGSQNMSIEYLNELKTHWNFNKQDTDTTLDFYGITKDPETKEFMMILEFAEKGNLRSFLLSDFNKIMWKDKIRNLYWITANLYDLHGLKYIHKDFHSGNILQIDDRFTYISDFGLSGPSTKQKSDDKICGVLPYIAPEVLNGEPYTLSSDIYSFGVIMTELSSGKPPFYNRKHDVSLALDICNANLYDLHGLKYIHKDFHSGNILQIDDRFTYISDFGLSGPSTKQKSDDKICGVLPYIAPEVLNGEPYTLSSDIYSFGVIMTELSSGKPPFYNRKHDVSLALDICNGLRPEFGKGTPEIYKKLAHKCMNANSSQRPTAVELYWIINFWRGCLNVEYYQEIEKYGYKGKEVKAAFEEADKEIPNISTSYKKNPEAIYTSRLFTFNNLTKPVNSSIITSYLDDEENNNEVNQDSQLVDLEVPSSLLQSKGNMMLVIIFCQNINNKLE